MSATLTPSRSSARKAAGLFDEIILDCFAGGGGASTGIEAALRRAVDVAINHDPGAIAMHSANHPHTLHMQSDVWEVDPVKATGGRPVGLAWFSPDCRHFSRAKGGKPVQKKIRSLAWVVVKWAKAVRPRVIILENVREFEMWGPLVAMPGVKGRDGGPVMLPCKDRKGQTFRKWVAQLRALGYVVEWRLLDAANYGAPTHRRRLFLIARCDGQAIVWPERTHGENSDSGNQRRVRGSQSKSTIGNRKGIGSLRPYKTAAECIDWTIPCPSIFLTKEEGRAIGVNRPLAEKTMKRIAMGLKKYVIENPRPFIVPVTHGGERRVHPVDEPLPTVTGANRGEMALATPYLVQVQNASAAGIRSVDRPAHTVTAHPKGGGMALVAPILSSYHHQKAGESRCSDVRKPINTLDTQNRYGLVAAFLAKHYGGVVGHGVDRPIGVVTAVDHHSVVAANLIHLNNNTGPSGADEPLRTVTAAGNHAALVYAFMIKYFGCGVGQQANDPLHTVTSRDRFGLVTVTIDGELYVIVDIGLRMLAPRELARAQGFPDSYILTGTKSNQVARIGNSVVPVMAEVLARANCVDMVAVGKGRVRR